MIREKVWRGLAITALVIVGIWVIAYGTLVPVLDDDWTVPTPVQACQ